MSFTDHKPKRIRKYDGTHVNIASYNNNLSKTKIRHIASIKQYATGPQQENKRHVHDVQVKHNKT